MEKFIKERIIPLYTMKRMLSVTIEEDKIERIETHVNKGIFRNKSHLIEFAIEKFLEDQNGL